MRLRIVFALLSFVVSLNGHAQATNSQFRPPFPIGAVKLLIRTTHPTFAPGEPLQLEVACVSVPDLVPPFWQDRWKDVCNHIELKVEVARTGGYWGGVGLNAWLQNRLHLCLLPAGESYKEEWSVTFSKPDWQPAKVPAEKVSRLRGLLVVRAEAVLKDGETELAHDYVDDVVAIVRNAEGGVEADSELQRTAAAFESGENNRITQLVNELLESSTEGSLRLAVRLFDNTRRTKPLLTVIENSPYQEMALDLMQARLKDPDFVPDYELLVDLTGMKARLDKPLEFEGLGMGTEHYPEYHPDLEDSSVNYFRTLFKSLVETAGDPASPRAAAIAEIAESVAECHRCPMGTYGLTCEEAVAAQAVARRGPSTQEERDRVVRIAHRLETAPLDESSLDEILWALNWLKWVPDIHVTLCPNVLGDFPRSEYRYNPQISFLLVLSSAAFAIEHPDQAEDSVAKQVAGVEGMLKAYQAILQEKPEAKSKVLDELLRKQEKGELTAAIRESSQSCK